MKSTRKTSHKRFILVGSAFAMCCVMARPALAIPGFPTGGEGLVISGQTIQNNIILNNNSPLSGTDGGASGGGGGLGLRVSSSQINGFTLNNSGAGSITGGNGTSSNGGGGAGVLFAAGYDFSGAGTISNITINNTANAIAGGNGSGSGSGGNGIQILATTTVNGVTINNSATIRGGNGSQLDGFEGFSGPGGHGIFISANGDVTGPQITNTGLILGGDGGAGSAGGIGIYMASLSDPSSVVISNSGQILGGAGGNGIISTGSPGLTVQALRISLNGSGGSGGHAIDLEAPLIDTVTITNGQTGTIQGGEGGYGTNNGSGGRGGDGVRLGAGYSATNGISNISVTNSGTIAGGEGGSTGNGNGGYGGDGGDGINVSNYAGTVSNLTVTNSSTGSLLGGNGGAGDAVGGDGGHGMTVFAETISGVTVTNQGLIAGGNGGAGGTGSGGSGGVGLDLEASTPKTLKNITITNATSGVIRGGNAGAGASGSSANGGEAIFLGGPASSNISIVNYGTITGGNATGSGVPGAGILISGNLSGVTIDNWGVISAGAGNNGIAIGLTGSNNVLNLNGHSAVYGKINGINGPGTSNTNILNLNFTGVSPAVQAQIKSQLTSQGVVAGQDANFTFTLRGITYVVDPMVVNLAMKSYQLQGLNANQQAVGANLDSFGVNPNGDMLALLNAIDQSGNVPLALEALSPQRYQVFSDIALANANSLTLEIDNRLNNRRYGSEVFDTSQFRVGTSAVEHQLGLSGRSPAAVAAGPDAKKTVTPAVVPDRRWGAWIAGTAVFGDLGGGSSLGDADFTTAGFLMGADAKVGESFVVGALFGYSNSNSNLDSVGSDADVETISGGLYGAWNSGPYYINALAAYSHNDYESQRVVAFPGVSRFASGSTDGNQFLLNVDGGYDWIKNGAFTLSPFVGLQYVYLDVAGFNETGAGAANLAVGSQDVDSLRSRLGVRANFRRVLSSSSVFAVDFRAEWQHEFLNDGYSITSSFINSGLGQFSVATEDPGSDAAVLGVGLNWTFRERYTIFADYDASIGGSSNVSQSIRGGFKIAF